MQREYLAQLSEPVQQFILDIENHAGIEIQVIPDFNLNDGGPAGQGNLAVVIRAQSIQLFAPTNGYFPDGAVRHELLHVRRFHVDGVPKLVLADHERWDKGFSDALGALDNAIEHVVIVPEELHLHPERLLHWEGVMREVCSGLPDVPEAERSLAICLHWTFLRHVMPNSPQIEIASSFAREHGLLEKADDFADGFISRLASKEELVRFLFLQFSDVLPKSRAALDYLNSMTGTRQERIP